MIKTILEVRQDEEEIGKCWALSLLRDSREGFSLEQCHKPELGLFPARMREISRPRLKAWLKRRRVWNVETKGNQEHMATGTNMNMPIPAS